MCVVSTAAEEQGEVKNEIPTSITTKSLCKLTSKVPMSRTNASSSSSENTVELKHSLQEAQHNPDELFRSLTDR